MDDGVSAPAKAKSLKPAWEPRQSGNPAGRPKGSRNKFGEAFVNDFLADWEEHGKQAIIDAREDSPLQYVKIAASILPRELNVKVGELDDLTDDQLARQLASIAAQLTAAGFDLGAGARAQEAPQPAPGISTVQ